MVAHRRRCNLPIVSIGSHIPHWRYLNVVNIRIARPTLGSYEQGFKFSIEDGNLVKCKVERKP